MVGVPYSEAGMHYIGIDIGKKESTWFACDDDGRRVAKGTMASSPQDAVALVDRFMMLREGVEVAVEAGNPTFKLARAMQSSGADVFVVHPLDNALIAQSRRKTDGIDAKMLAEQRRLHMLSRDRVHVPSALCEDLRHLTTAREALVSDRRADRQLRAEVHDGLAGRRPGAARLGCRALGGRLCQPRPALQSS